MSGLGGTTALFLVFLGLALTPRPGDGQAPEADSVRGPAREVQEALRRELHALDRRLAADPGDHELRLRRLQSLYVLSVEDRECLAEARREVGLLRELTGDRGGAAVLDAYHSALGVVEAKHAFWPHDKVLKLRQGLAGLDALVEEHPDHAEIRFLRLASSFFLPFPFSRPGVAEEDLARLQEQLLADDPHVSARVLIPAATFVLENGEPGDSVRVRLEEALEAARTEASVGTPPRGGGPSHG